VVQTFGNTKIYEDTLVKPRAWLEGDGSVVVTYWSPNQIRLTTNGSAGKLVLSEVLYPGWQAWVDGQPVAIELYEGLFRSLDLGSGLHQVVFEFRPPTVFVGAAIAGIGWLAVLAILMISSPGPIQRWFSSKRGKSSAGRIE